LCLFDNSLPAKNFLGGQLIDIICFQIRKALFITCHVIRVLATKLLKWIDAQIIASTIEGHIYLKLLRLSRLNVSPILIQALDLLKALLQRRQLRAWLLHDKGGALRVRIIAADR